MLAARSRKLAAAPAQISPKSRDSVQSRPTLAEMGELWTDAGRPWSTNVELVSTPTLAASAQSVGADTRDKRLTNGRPNQGTHVLVSMGPLRPTLGQCRPMLADVGRDRPEEIKRGPNIRVRCVALTSDTLGRALGAAHLGCRGNCSTTVGQLRRNSGQQPWPVGSPGASFGNAW